MTIEENNTAFEVAGKLIYGTIWVDGVFGGKVERSRFDLNDLSEIRDYLTIYLNHHKEDTDDTN